MDTVTRIRQNQRANPALHPLASVQTMAAMLDHQRQVIARLRNGLRLIAGSDPATRDLAEKIIKG